jgi:hypothetical protein
MSTVDTRTPQERRYDAERDGSAYFKSESRLTTST